MDVQKTVEWVPVIGRRDGFVEFINNMKDRGVNLLRESNFTYLEQKKNSKVIKYIWVNSAHQIRGMNFSRVEYVYGWHTMPDRDKDEIEHTVRARIMERYNG